MKGSLVAVAALLGGASAHQQRHAHDAIHHLKRSQSNSDKACTPVVKTVTGDFTWTPTPNAQPAVKNTTSTTLETLLSSQTSTVSVPAVISSAAAIPTPAAQTCPTPGTYTFPASTMTVTATTSAVVPSSTVCTAGTYTLGGTTTVVETSTVVTCPYATVSTNSAGVVTSVIKETVYTCPVAGTYTIVPGTTTTVTSASETVTVPVITTYLPGTYTAPAVTTEVVTSTVVYCPFASVDATTSSSVAVPTSAVEVATSSAAAVGAAPSAAVSGVSSAAASASSAVSSVVSSASASATSTASSATLGGSGSSPWSLTYTPYNPLTGDCQSAAAVEADLAAIAAVGFTSIRVYSTDCDTLPNVGAAAAKWGLKIIAGIYIGEAGCTNESPDVESQIAAFKAWDNMDLVELFAVANEAVNDGYCTASELAALITHVKSELGSLYSGPWTTTDVVATWQETDFASAICPLVDVVAANAHAYFTSTVAPADAGEFVQSQLDIIEGACSGLTGYILESGYPTSGDTIGLAVPSVANQAIAIKSILDAVGDRVVLFSMFDDKWKAAGEYNCEQSWGIVPSLFGTVGAAWEALVAAL